MKWLACRAEVELLAAEGAGRKPERTKLITPLALPVAGLKQVEVTEVTRRKNGMAWRLCTWMGVPFLALGLWATTLAFSHPDIWVFSATAYFVGVFLLVNGLLRTKLVWADVPM